VWWVRGKEHCKAVLGGLTEQEVANTAAVTGPWIAVHDNCLNAMVELRANCE